MPTTETVRQLYECVLDALAVIDMTYGRDADGNPDDSPPAASGSDVVDALCVIEPRLRHGAEAARIALGIPPDSAETDRVWLSVPEIGPPAVSGTDAKCEYPGDGAGCAGQAVRSVDGLLLCPYHADIVSQDDDGRRPGS